MKVSYYPGCTLDASSKLYDLQVRAVFSCLGIELNELDDWNCCGATSGSKTDDFLAVALPARNLGIADNMGLEEMIIPCSSCYSRMLVAQRSMVNDSALREKVNGELQKKFENKTKVTNIVDMLFRLSESGAIDTKVVKPLKGIRAACYYGCLQTRFPIDININYDVENPQAMERVCKSTGVESIDWSFKTDCCGASASVNDTDTSLNLMGSIIKDAFLRKANCFVTTCPMCQMNLDAYQKDASEKIGVNKSLPVFFITELVGLSMGIDPYKMQIERHFIDPIPLLKEHGLL